MKKDNDDDKVETKTEDDKKVLDAVGEAAKEDSKATESKPI